MSQSRTCTLLVLVAACGKVTANATDAAGGPNDAAEDAPGTTARCDPSKPFGVPTLVQNINSSLDEVSFSLTQDEKTGFVGRYTGTTGGSRTILSTQRESAAAQFGTPNATSTAGINAAAGDEWKASSSPDGLILYISRDTGSSGSPNFGVYVATRTDTGASFDAGTLATVNGTALTSAFDPTISTDGQTLYWGDISFAQVLSATRMSNAASFGNQRVAANAQAPVVVSADELTMYSALGGRDVLAATRTNKASPFGGSSVVVNVNSTVQDLPVALTYDGCVLYISSNRPGGPGGYDIWEAHRPQ